MVDKLVSNVGCLKGNVTGPKGIPAIECLLSIFIFGLFLNSMQAKMTIIIFAAKRVIRYAIS